MYKEFTDEEIKKADKEIENFFVANKCLDFCQTPNFDIIKLCSSLGFEMLSLNLDRGIDGVVLVKSGKKIIGVSNRVAPRASRFVVAHELAHYIHESRGKR